MTCAFSFYFAPDRKFRVPAHDFHRSIHQKDFVRMRFRPMFGWHPVDEHGCTGDLNYCRIGFIHFCLTPSSLAMGLCAIRSQWALAAILAFSASAGIIVLWVWMLNNMAAVGAVLSYIMIAFAAACAGGGIASLVNCCIAEAALCDVWEEPSEKTPLVMSINN